SASGPDFVEGLAAAAAEYGRFNLLLWDGGSLMHASNHPRFAAHPIDPGAHAVSNGAFDERWPKSAHATRALSAWLSSPMVDAGYAAGVPLLEPLFDALADTAPAPDGELPDTGVGLELERALSPPFVRGEHYGTRCSSVVLVGPDAITFVERRFGPDGSPRGESAARLLRSG
ncbi:MAG TPA: NRDE family protein, partial [Lysobacter sp.]